MKIIRTLAPCLAATVLLAGLGRTAGERDDALGDVRSAMTVASYEAVPVIGDPVAGTRPAYELANATRGMRTRLTAEGLRVRPVPGAGDWEWRLSLLAWGRTGEELAVTAVDPRARGCMIEYQRGALVEWYLNDPRGLEQGFTLAAPPEGDPALAVELVMAVHGELTGEVSADGRDLEFRVCEAVVLRYGGLAVWDATGRELDAHLALSGERLRIVVDDAGAVYPVTVDPLVVTEVQKLSPGDYRDYSGTAVAFDRYLAVIGAPGNATDHEGEAHVYRRSGWAGAYTREAILGPGSGAGMGARFGESVDVVDGYGSERVVVGAPRANDTVAGTDVGAAYVFVNGPTGWTQQHVLQASDKAAYDEFGSAVAISDDLAVVGARYDDTIQGSNSGSVYTFERTNTSWDEVETAIVPADASASDYFGSAVSMDGYYYVVGSPNHDGLASNAGAAYVYRWNGSSSTQQAKLESGQLPADALGDLFGYSVAIDATTVAVGVRDDDVVSVADAGTAYAFVRSGSTWSYQDRFWAYDAASGDEFGCSVAVDGNTIIVGARYQDVSNVNSNDGAAYVFTRNGASWTDHQPYVSASDAAGSDEFGRAVAVSGNQFIAGAPFDDDVAVNAGAAYVFQPAAAAYCTSSVTTNECEPVMSGYGEPSLTRPHGEVFCVTASNVEGAKSGMLFWGRTAPPLGLPWGTGYLCIKSPLRRTPARNSGGDPGTCEGILSLDFNQWLVAHASDHFLVSGDTVHMQAWFRDPPALKTTNMSNAISFVVGE